MKYPIGIQDFERIREDGYLYFDKTALIYDLVHSGKVYFLCRPRRFGKSLLMSTLKCYFEGRKELFRGLAIERLETEWTPYPVMHLSFGGQNYNAPDTLELVLERFIADAEQLYGKGENARTYGDRFRAVIANARKRTGRRAVVLVDEYDKPLLDVMELEDRTTRGGVAMTLEENNRNVLKGFYGVFKEADPDLQFVMLTGVTKFSQISVFSGFNQPNDISMSTQFDTLCGITDEELSAYLPTETAEMAEAYHVTVDQMKAMLRKQYDGYHFSRRMKGIYNPFSILRAFDEKFLEDYWFQTASPTYLVRLLADNDEQINELVGKYYGTEDFVDYRADKERPLPMIYQSGYLTIKDYDPRLSVYLLDFPNAEVQKGFVTMLASNYLSRSGVPTPWLREVIMAFDGGDTARLEALFTSYFAGIPYPLRGKRVGHEKERHFQYTFFLVLRMIGVYTTYVEKQQSEGRVDCVVETQRHVYIFEFKRDGSAAEALRQIEEKGYGREYLADKRTLHKIGVNFSSRTGTIDGWMSSDGQTV